MTTPTIRTGTRAANLQDIVALLQDHHARRVDIVAPASRIQSQQGFLAFAGLDPIIEDDGVTDANGTYLPTYVADEGIAQKLGIPTGYLRRLRETYPALYDNNVNGWLRHQSMDNKRFLVRVLRGDDGSTGVARAFLSDVFKPIDNLDILMTALDGIRDAGVDVVIPDNGADLTDSRMYVKVWAPQIAQMAPEFLKGYRSPFDHGIVRAGGWTPDRVARAAAREGSAYAPGTEPVMFAGFVISNSEVGKGAFSITPQLVVQVCRNGLTISTEALKQQHLGGKLEEGVIKWSSDTMSKSLALVRAQARDAVTTFLSPEYLAAKVEEIEQIAGAPVDDPVETIEFVSKKLKYDEDRQRDLMRHFTLGGQLTAGGVAQAITSLAQTLDDADVAAGMESDAIPAMELVAARS